MKEAESEEKPKINEEPMDDEDVRLTIYFSLSLTSFWELSSVF